ncbi:MAG: S1 family peptidase [Henriciella sp.]|mgnify:CR=1 FL=1|jgi:S1-C subfamily serine protease
MRLVPDWVVYVLALSTVVFALFSAAPQHDAPRTLPEAIDGEGATLPPPSAFDERVLVRVTKPKTGIGTAFAINHEGFWLTARHVVDGCDDIALLTAPHQYIRANRVRVSDHSDLALLETDTASHPVILDVETDLRIGTYGYHVGYPQGRPGEAVSRLQSRINLVSSGTREGTESVLAWAEAGRTRGLSGSLGGLSGGPVYGADGRVRGVIVAESPRRGRIYSASPESVAQFLGELNVDLAGAPPRAFTPSSYGAEADFARRKLQVVKLACNVGDAG